MVPSKFYGVLAAGRPILYIGDKSGEVARVIDEEQCGFVFAPGDVSGLSVALRTLAVDRNLAAQMGDRARRVVVEKTSAAIAMRKWLVLLEQVASRRR
jgi:glycosyltransferase involved in cell wall biosynthesis